MTGYEIRHYTTQDACSCPDYLYRRMQVGEDCKHMMTLKAAHQLIDAQELYNLRVDLERATERQEERQTNATR